MLNAEMSTRAVVRQCNANFSTINCIQHRIWESCRTSNQPHNRRTHVTTSALDLHIQRFRMWDRMKPATQTADEAVGLHNQRMSAQTVRNHLREAHLRACRPHRCLDLTEILRRERLVGKSSPSMATGTLEKCALKMNPGFNCTS